MGETFVSIIHGNVKRYTVLEWVKYKLSDFFRSLVSHKQQARAATKQHHGTKNHRTSQCQPIEKAH